MTAPPEPGSLVKAGRLCKHGTDAMRICPMFVHLLHDSVHDLCTIAADAIWGYQPHYFTIFSLPEPTIAYTSADTVSCMGPCSTSWCHAVFPVPMCFAVSVMQLQPCRPWTLDCVPDGPLVFGCMQPNAPPSKIAPLQGVEVKVRALQHVTTPVSRGPEHSDTLTEQFWHWGSCHHLLLDTCPSQTKGVSIVSVVSAGCMRG